MKPMNPVLKLDWQQEYPPSSSLPPNYRPRHAPPSARLDVIFEIDDSLVNSFPNLGIAARYLFQAKAQQIVISILDPKNRRQWTTSLQTKEGLAWAFAFDENEAKILKPYFKAGNRLEVNISSLENLELSISLPHFESQST